jgi:hypothetical protein
LWCSWRQLASALSTKRQAAGRAKTVNAPVDRAASGAGAAQSGFAKLAQRVLRAERSFQPTQLVVCSGRLSELLLHDLRPLGAEPAKLDQEAAQITQLHLTQPA